MINLDNIYGVMSLIFFCLAMIFLYVLVDIQSKHKAARRLIIQEEKHVYLDKLFDYIKVNRFLSQIYLKLYNRIHLFCETPTDAKYLTLKVIVGYAIVSFVLIGFFLTYSRIWYAILIEVAISIIIPFLGLHFYLNKQVLSILSELPDALDEIEVNYYRLRRLREAIDESVPNMPKRISRVFKMLSYNMVRNQSEAIDMLRKSFNHVYMNSLCSLLELNVNTGGDISSQIHHLNLIIHDDITFTKQSKSSLLIYKLLTILLIIAVPIGTSILNTQSELYTQYNQSSISASNGTIVAILIGLVYILILELLEHIQV